MNKSLSEILATITSQTQITSENIKALDTLRSAASQLDNVSESTMNLLPFVTWKITTQRLYMNEQVNDMIDMMKALKNGRVDIKALRSYTSKDADLSDIDNQDTDFISMSTGDQGQNGNLLSRIPLNVSLRFLIPIYSQKDFAFEAIVMPYWINQHER